MAKKKLALVPWTALPKQVKPTWGDNSRKQIISLMQEGKSTDEIADITGNKISFVKAVIHRASNPEEFISETPTKRQISGNGHRVTIAYKNCGKEFEEIPSKQDRKFCSRRCLWDGRDQRRPA